MILSCKDWRTFMDSSNDRTLTALVDLIASHSEKITAGTKQNPPGQQVQSLSLVMNQAWSKCNTDFAEVFNSNRVFLHASHLISSHHGLPLPLTSCFDIRTGWIFPTRKMKIGFGKFYRKKIHPWYFYHLLSPICRSFSILMNVNWNKMNPMVAQSAWEEKETASV